MTTLDPTLWYADSATDPARGEAARSLAAMIAEMRGLRPFSPAVQKLLLTIQDEYFTVNEVTRLIESDATLAARVMRTVNSAAVGLRSRCKSVGQAVTLLGTRALTSMASAMALLEKFGGGGGAAALVTEHSAGVAAAVRVLGARCNLPEQDALFTCGLLHDVGKLLILQASDSLPIGLERDPYPKMLECNATSADVIHILERQLFGYDHAVLAGHVLGAWLLPAPLPQVIGWHHQPERAYQAGGDIAKLVAAVRLADRLSYDLRRHAGPDAFLLSDLAGANESKILGLDDARLEQMWEDLLEAVNVTRIDA